jgi:hypothetical protein
MKILATLSVLALATVAAANGARGAECRTVSEFAAAFKDGTECSVNSCLYGVITASDSAPTHPYPEGFGKAWLSGYRTLTSILQFKHEKGAACRLTDQTLQMAGFPRPFDGAPYQLHVMDEHQIDVPMPVFRKLADAGRDFTSATGCTGGTDPETQKPIDALTCVTGSRFPDQDTCSCSSEFVDAYRKMRDLSPYDAGQTSAACFKQLKSMALTEPVLRAALWACQDVSPYNAFNGLGFDGTELTMPEFIIDNISFEKMTPHAVAHIALPDPASCPAQ